MLDIGITFGSSQLSFWQAIFIDFNIKLFAFFHRGRRAIGSFTPSSKSSS